METFAYSYYQFRPAEHNLTSEWDFLYNKAHNEYLNYLSTTGIVGFGTYLLVIGAFLVYCIKYLVLSIKQKIHNTYYIILTTALLASYTSYLIYNFFLFSVVILAVFFYLFPALVFVVTDSTRPLTSNFKYLTSHFSLLTSILYRRPLYTKIAKGIVIFSTLYLLYSIFQLWYADTIFNLGQKASDSGNPGRAYNFLTIASQLNKAEPFYRSELAYSAAAAAAALSGTDASLSAELKDQTILEMEKVLNESPKNVSYARTAIRTYFELASLDKIYIDKTLEMLDRAISLAPTDPKLYYNKALILQSMDKNEEAVEVLKKALQLKPNYLQVKEQLKEATASGTKN